MKARARFGRRLCCTLASAALIASAAALAQAPAGAVPIPGGQATTLWIPGADGVRLNAIITAPADIATHKNPLVLQPSGWGMPAMGSIGSAYRLSTGENFISIEYTARGMYLSEGEVDLLGHKDAEDASAVIDWAIANLNVDPDRIAIAGGSYGAGMSLIAAAHDPRIKAIVADSPPTDIGEALAPNGTPKTGGPIALALAGVQTNRFSTELIERGLPMILGNDAYALQGVPNEHLLAEAIPKLNANGTAVFLAHDWQDSLLPSGPAFTMFDELTGPKMLYMQAGDHSTGGGAGQVAGLPNAVWDAGIRWLDHYVNGADNGIDREAPVQLAPANGGIGAPYTGFPSAAAAMAAARTFPLSAPAAGVMGADPAESWSQPLFSGPTIAVAAVPYVSGTVAQLGLAPAIPLGGVDRNLAGVWRTAPFAGGGVVSGTTALKLTVLPQTSDLTLIGILYDEGPDGTGTVVTYAPVTRHGLTAGAPNEIAWELAATHWNLAPGHRLTLTVTSQDPIPFVSSTPLGSMVTFAAPSTVDIPVNAA
ncbi:prolyl oligopeptidase family serine peptidase [Nocardia huaxiensis]|uniref:Prolyl oligopeptidase family serine peptidase n=1 Tax=Nocardia huaxiensis TaxID=2755382 RepID=A0A7D6ZJM7_9NOCA|nr:CocE/NonD family hydrolase [Nocardia huaxiensis]QLY32187.1 prolyl oligopeptidase family serine peptidase [Nocardia huaxiensis]